MFVFTHIASLLLNGIGSLQKVRCLTLVFGLLLTGIGFPLYAQIEQEFCIDKFPDKIEICVDLEPGEFLDPDGSTSVFDCSLSPSGDFCVKYTPLPLFEGPDTVLIQICKIADPDDCYFLTYIVYVGCIQPDAVNDAANANGTTTIDVTANDWVKCADISGIKIKTNPTHGTAVVSGLNIIYTPDECYNGTDKIIYELINSCGKKDVATVNLTVSANNVAPDAKNDTGTSTDGNQVCVSVLNNDFDADGDAMTINTFGQGTNGVVVKSGNKLCYTPNSGFSGTDVFTYKICDPCNLCDQATVAITVEKLNQPPVANNDEGTTEGDPVCIKVMTNDYDPDGDPIAVTTYTQPIKGSVNYNPRLKSFVLRPQIIVLTM
ncbi:MAG: tandem-95 repeat protein [Sphingobacteriales bacterium]|nr:tandem-95 repeat protein [Sphingobacteriales bacterium]